jgi:uncharacterized protein (AIM24 family)
MQHEILGEHFQWLKIQLQSERIRGTYQKLLLKSEGIEIGDGNTFSGTGFLIFCGNGKIKEFYLGDKDNIVLNEECILAADIETGKESLSTNYVNLVQFFGPGTVFICGKEFAEFYLEETESVEVRTSCIVGMDSSITFQMGSQFSVLTGAGAILLESIVGNTVKPEPLKGSLERALKYPESETDEPKFPFFDKLDQL